MSDMPELQGARMHVARTDRRVDTGHLSVVQGSRRKTFASEAHEWPGQACSRFVEAGGLDWHVQICGSGPTLLLLHGTGASCHSWRDCAPILSRMFRVIAPDLPGHGFTSSPQPGGFTLNAFARSVGQLLRALDAAPAIVAGHSAGAAVLVRMVLDRVVTPDVVIGINAALLPFSGLPRWLFAPTARLLARTSFVPRWVAHQAADLNAIERLIGDTGSRLDPVGIRLYQRLAQRPEHVAGALSMMANWDLDPLVHELPRLQTPLALLTAEADRTVAPAQARRVCGLLGDARVVSLGKLGHLAHEEQPQPVCDEILRLAIECGAMARSRPRH